MTIASLFFVFLFLPLALILNTILPTIAKNVFLLIVSFVFYSWLDPSSLILLVLCICWDYVCGLQMDRKPTKINLGISIAFHLILLAVYKYFNTGLAMPIGLSFFTFSSISYLIDVYQQKTSAQKNWIRLALYLSFFGKVTMGPIVQYCEMEKQLGKRNVNVDQIMDGICLFIKGLAKKVILADRLALIFNGLYGNKSMLGAWIVTISYMLQIYYDFSGYSDMAIGLSKCFGFEFKENFNHPYIATSIEDFWKRWHISLSEWFKEYVYMPLGGSQVSLPIYVRNIFIVWLCIGIWHGASLNYILWGLYFGALLVLEKLFLKDVLGKLPSWLQHVYTLSLVLISWIFFFSPNFSSTILSIVHLFGIGVKGIWDKKVWYYITTSFLYLLFGIVFTMPVVDMVEKRMYRMKRGGTIALTILYGLVFLICVSFLVLNSSQSFLYGMF